LITVEQWQTEFTRYGYTKESLATFFETKGSVITKYEKIIKESVWTSFKTHLTSIEGYTSTMEYKLYQLMFATSDYRQMTEELSKFLTTEFKFTSY